MKSESLAAKQNAVYERKKNAATAKKMATWGRAREGMEREKVETEMQRERREEEARQRNLPKILIIDIETAPLELHGWKLFDENFSLDQISQDWTILSYAAKWFEKPKLLYADTGGRGVKQVRNDQPLMRGLRALLDEATLVVAQNGKKFDCRKINARLIKHGFSPPSPYRVIDTMLEARRYFAFTSQKLKYTSEILGVPPKDEHEEFPGFKLWSEVLKDNPRAWKVMQRYNKQDIISTEHVYKRIRPWIKNHPNVGAYLPDEKPACPHCGSYKVVPQGNEIKNQTVYQRMLCLTCKGWSRGKIMLNSLSKRRTMLASE